MRKLKKYVVTIKIPRPVFKEYEVYCASQKEAIEAVKQEDWFSHTRHAYVNTLPKDVECFDISGELLDDPRNPDKRKMEEPSILQIDELNKS